MHRIIPSRNNGTFCNVAISAAKSKTIENISGKNGSITMDDILKAEIHPEDESVYKDYTRCRWKFGEKEISSSGVVQMKGWIPYYRLDERKKEIVSRKKASSEQLAIWTKWPQATVDASVC